MKRLFSQLRRFYSWMGDRLSYLMRGVLNSNFFMAVVSLLLFLLLQVNTDYKTIYENKVPIYVFLIFLTFAKCGYFLLYSLEKVAETYVADKSFNWFLLRFTSVFFLLILSFGTDAWILQQVNSTNFKNVPSVNYLKQAFDFLYYSFMNFTTVGFGEIAANSRIARFYSALEVFIGFSFVAYILSSFSSVREGLIKDKPLNIDYEDAKAKAKRG